MKTIETTIQKEINPNKLPFLQAQILQKIFIDYHLNKQTTFEELSLITDYPKDSKILRDAFYSLITKGFIDGEYGQISISSYSKKIMENFIQQNDYKHKIYSDKIIQFLKNGHFSHSLFEEAASISGLNKQGVIHKWYDYLEDFPYQLIEEKIKEYNLQSNSLVVEPFAGSGTTLISSNLFGCNSIGFDANPLMTFISEVKTTWDIDLSQFKKTVFQVATQFMEKIKIYDGLELNQGFLKYMPLKELNQWLSPSLQKEVVLLKNLIVKIDNIKIKNLLLLAMSKACFDASYVSLCPGTTFYPFREKEKFWDIFSNKVIQIYKDLESIQEYTHFGKSQLINDSCLSASKYIKKDTIDFIITSPPYPNDLEYTRQTRLELYLLDFVKDMNDVQMIKRKMVKGSTKLIFKESNSEQFVTKFHKIREISENIQEQLKDKNWGFDYPRMVREYFGDMYLCMKEFYHLLKSDAHFLQVVGDQTVKGVYIPVCDILIEMAEEIGYKNCKKELFRMRRSTGHTIQLPEEIVTIQK